MRAVAMYNIKGGVGKTSTAVNLAWLAAESGRRTLLWDLDPQGAASYVLRVKPKVKGGARKLISGDSAVEDLVKGTDFERLDVLPSDFSYRNLDLALDDAKNPVRRLGRVLEPLADDYDLVVMDCAPSISLVSESVIRAADVLVVPLIPSPLSLRTFDQIRAFLGDLDHTPPPVLAFFSMVDRRKRLHRDTVESLPRERPEIRPIVVPNASVVEQMTVRRAPVVAWAAASEAAQAYRALWEATAALL